MRIFLIAFACVACSAYTLDAVVPRFRDGACGVEKTRGCYGKDRLRIAVLALATRNSNPVSIATSWITTLYTQKHGYDYIIERCAASTHEQNRTTEYMWDRENKNQGQINWSKSLALLKHLPYYDAVLFADSDVVFVNMTYKIEDFINQYMVPRNTSVAVGEDCWDKWGCWNGFPGLNTGIILARNKQPSFDLLTDWANAAEDGRCAQDLFAHPREQTCLGRISSAHGQHMHAFDTILWKGDSGTWMEHIFNKNASKVMEMALFHLEKEHANLYGVVKSFVANELAITENGAVAPWEIDKGCDNKALHNPYNCSSPFEKPRDDPSSP